MTRRLGSRGARAHRVDLVAPCGRSQYVAVMPRSTAALTRAASHHPFDTHSKLALVLIVMLGAFACASPPPFTPTDGGDASDIVDDTVTGDANPLCGNCSGGSYTPCNSDGTHPPG